MFTLFLFLICTSFTETDAISAKLQDYANDIKVAVETEEYKKAEEYIANKQYEEAFAVLAKAMLEHPEIQRAYILAMSTLTNNVPLEDKNKCAEIFLNRAKEILPQIDYENQKILAEFISGTESLRGNYSEASAYADALIQNTDANTVEYANAVYGRAIIAIQNNKYNEAMILLEDLRRHKDYYPSDIQDKNDFQLFFVYYHLKKDDFVIKLGEELREKFRKKEIKSGHDVFDRLYLLANLGDTYYFNTKDFEKAYEIYKELVELGDKYSELLEKSGIFEMSWKPLLLNALRHKNSLDPSSSTITNEISEPPEEIGNNQNFSEKAQVVTTLKENPLSQNTSNHNNNILKPLTTNNKYPDYSTNKLIDFFIIALVIVPFIIVFIYLMQRKRKRNI